MSSCQSIAEAMGGYLEFRPDGLRNAGGLLSLLLLLGGLVLLGVRVWAALRRRDVWRILPPLRMMAVLGALGGFVAYLRDHPLPDARLGLVLGGLAASPWVAVVLLEEIRRRIRVSSSRE